MKNASYAQSIFIYDKKAKNYQNLATKTGSNMRHGNNVMYTILYTDQFKSDFIISYYLTYLLCDNIK